ncbi:MAG TPA: LptA/OstA family protein [Propylenella sp.]
MRVLILATTALALALFGRAPAAAQDFGAAFSGFDTGSDDPIQIEADRLEVHDPEKLAVYSGNVRVRQGQTVLEAPELRVFYAGEAEPGGVPGSQVSRIEAGPGVTVRSGDQTATGNTAVLDMGRDLITMSGNVVLTQGSNIVRGDRLVVDLATKEGRVEGGRVQTLIAPSGGAPAGAP